MKKCAIFICLFLAFGFSISAFAQTNQEITRQQKLEQELKTLKEGDLKRLEVLSKLSRFVVDTNQEPNYINILIKESKLVDNQEYLCKAYMHKIIMAYNSYDFEGVDHWVALLEPLAAKNKLYDQLFRAMRCRIDMLLVREKYEQGEIEGTKMLAQAQSYNNKSGIVSAYQVLANTYQMSFRQEKSIEILEKIYDTALELDGGYSVEISNSLISLYEGRDNNKWFEWINKQERNLRNMIKKGDEKALALRPWMMLTYVIYANYYIKMGNMYDAERYLNLAQKEYSHGGILEIFMLNYYNSRYNYYSKKGEYERAINYADSVINCYGNSYSLSRNAMIQNKARILRQMEQSENSLVLYKKVFHEADSIHISLINKQSEEIQKNYNIDQMHLEDKEATKDINLVLSLLVLASVFGLSFFVLKYYRLKKHLVYSENEMRKHKEEMEKANIAKDNFLATINTAISAPLDNIVKGSLRLASDEKLDSEEQLKMAGFISNTSELLMKLINNILDLSRLEAGMMKLNFSNIDLALTMRMVVNNEISKQRVAEGTQVNAGNSTLFVSVDEARIVDMLSYILDDVISPDKKLSISIRREGFRVCTTIVNSKLSSKENEYHIAIANELNRSLAKNFMGKYIVDTSTATITIYLPLVLE